MHASELNDLKIRAKSGDRDAEFDLGLYYADGVVDEEGQQLLRANSQKAVAWFRKAAEHGHSAAKASLGLCLSDGCGARKDEHEALLWLKRAVKDGVWWAATNIAEIYREKGNHRRAFFWFVRASDMGDDDALFDVGWCYCTGHGVKRDYGKGIMHLNRAVTSDCITEYGRQKAMTLLGILYYNGMGLDASLSLAKQWLDRAVQIDADKETLNLRESINNKKPLKPEDCKHSWVK